MTDRRIVSAAAVAGFGLLAAMNAAAMESGFYAGLSVGQAEHDLSKSDVISSPDEFSVDSGFSLEKDSTGFGAFAGWQFGQWFAVEGSLAHLGQYEQRLVWTLPFSPTERWDYESNSELTIRAASISALVTLPIGESFVAGLRAGAAYSKVEFDINEEFRINGAIDEIGRHDASTNNIAPVYGATLEYLPTSRFSLRLDWQRFSKVGEEHAFVGMDIDSLTLSALMRF